MRAIHIEHISEMVLVQSKDFMTSELFSGWIQTNPDAQIRKMDSSFLAEASSSVRLSRSFADQLEQESEVLIGCQRSHTAQAYKGCPDGYLLRKGGQQCKPIRSRTTPNILCPAGYDPDLKSLVMSDYDDPLIQCVLKMKSYDACKEGHLLDSAVPICLHSSLVAPLNRMDEARLIEAAGEEVGQALWALSKTESLKSPSFVDRLTGTLDSLLDGVALPKMVHQREKDILSALQGVWNHRESPFPLDQYRPVETSQVRIIDDEEAPVELDSNRVIF
eukprot:GHVH01002770.1.p2 GENE.GHVH01002770.1~~GHVH01002770.1.p2  ORF type:complete len:276 (+),score=46.69 GHVH01002770.1:452-1279(+)